MTSPSVVDLNDRRLSNRQCDTDSKIRNTQILADELSPAVTASADSRVDQILPSRQLNEECPPNSRTAPITPNSFINESSTATPTVDDFVVEPDAEIIGYFMDS
jgi:hypothetical protein